MAGPSGIYYIPDSKPRCGCHHDDQYADGTYGGYLEGVVSTARQKTIIGLGLFLAGLPVLLLAAMYAFHMLAVYQEARIRSYLTSSGDAYYMTSMLHKFNENISFWGNSGNDVLEGLPEFNKAYVFPIF